MNAGLDALLYEPMGVGGITLATAIVSLVTTVALAIALRGQLGGVDMARTVRRGHRGSSSPGRCAPRSRSACARRSSGLGDSLLEQTVLVAAASAAGLARLRRASCWPRGSRRRGRSRPWFASQFARLAIELGPPAYP